MAPDYDKKVPESNKKYLKKARGHISRNVVQITIKMRTIVRISQIILIIKPHLKHSEKVPESDKKYLKKVGGHISRNVVQITMVRTIV